MGAHVWAILVFIMAIGVVVTVRDSNPDMVTATYGRSLGRAGPYGRFVGSTARVAHRVAPEICPRREEKRVWVHLSCEREHALMCYTVPEGISYIIHKSDLRWIY